MAMSQEEILEVVITELTEKSLAELRDTEKNNHPNLYHEVKELSGKVVKILAQMSEEDRETIEKYFDQKDRLTNKELKHLYLQGAKDCIKLLKYLKII